MNRLVSGLPERAIFAVLERYAVFDHHFSVYIFFATYGIAIGHVIASLLVGCMVRVGGQEQRDDSHDCAGSYLLHNDGCRCAGMDCHEAHANSLDACMELRLMARDHDWRSNCAYAPISHDEPPFVRLICRDDLQVAQGLP